MNHSFRKIRDIFYLVDENGDQIYLNISGDVSIAKKYKNYSLHFYPDKKSADTILEMKSIMKKAAGKLFANKEILFDISLVGCNCPECQDDRSELNYQLKNIYPSPSEMKFDEFSIENYGFDYVYDEGTLQNFLNDFSWNRDIKNLNLVVDVNLTCAFVKDNQNKELNPFFEPNIIVKEIQFANEEDNFGLATKACR